MPILVLAKTSSNYRLRWFLGILKTIEHPPEKKMNLENVISTIAPRERSKQPELKGGWQFKN